MPELLLLLIVLPKVTPMLLYSPMLLYPPMLLLPMLLLPMLLYPPMFVDDDDVVAVAAVAVCRERRGAEGRWAN